jgi:hypothetical protein
MSPRVWPRLLAAVMALVAGVSAVVVAIVLVKGTL